MTAAKILKNYEEEYPNQIFYKKDIDNFMKEKSFSGPTSPNITTTLNNKSKDPNSRSINYPILFKYKQKDSELKKIEPLRLNSIIKNTSEEEKERHAISLYLRWHPNIDFTKNDVVDWVDKGFELNKTDITRRAGYLFDSFDETNIKIFRKEYRLNRIKKKPRSSNVFIYTPPPATYYYKSIENETDYYPLLIKYIEKKAREKLALSDCIEIEHLKSNRDEDSSKHFLFPDVVGVKEEENPDYNKMDPEVQKHTCKKITKYYSFEVKKELDKYNIRKSFSQTIMNSAWANYSYIVAGTIEVQVKNDAKIFSRRYGVGVILLNKNDPIKSSILYPAKEKVKVDWGMANILAKSSEKFKEFLKKSV